MSATAVPASPTAARQSAPRWRDSRLIGGVALLLMSMVAGARLMAASDHTDLVLAAATELPAGHVVAASDLQPQRVHLSAGTGGYWLSTEAASLVGRRLDHRLGRDELLARSAVASETAPDLREVPIVVDPARMPALRPDALVDVYTTTKPVEGTPRVALLLSAVEFAGSPEAQDSGSSKIRVLLHVLPADVKALITASETGEIDLVQHLGAQPSAAQPGLAADTPTSRTPSASPASPKAAR